MVKFYKSNYYNCPNCFMALEWRPAPGGGYNVQCRTYYCAWFHDMFHGDTLLEAHVALREVVNVPEIARGVGDSLRSGQSPAVSE